jgi:hypothetical protein
MGSRSYCAHAQSDLEIADKPFQTILYDHTKWSLLEVEANAKPRMSWTPAENAGACRSPRESASRKHEQTQPGQTCWIESTRLSGSDIGKVKERTSACEASVLLYNFWVKQR